MSEESVYCVSEANDSQGLSPKASYIALHAGLAFILLTVLTSIFVKAPQAFALELALMCLFFTVIAKKIITKTEAIRTLSLIVPVCVGIYLSASLI